MNGRAWVFCAVGLTILPIMGACDHPTDSSDVELRFALDVGGGRDLPALTVLQSATIQAFAETGSDDVLLESRTVDIPQGEAIVPVTMAVPDRPATFRATVISNNGTRVLGGESAEVTARAGDRVPIQLTGFDAVPIFGASPAEVTVTRPDSIARFTLENLADGVIGWPIDTIIPAPQCVLQVSQRCLQYDIEVSFVDEVLPPQTAAPLVLRLAGPTPKAWTILLGSQVGNLTITVRFQ